MVSHVINDFAKMAIIIWFQVTQQVNQALLSVSPLDQGN